LPQYVGSKWRKTAAILRNPSLQSIVPKTVRFNRAQLMSMLEKFEMVYVKPDTGSHGNGVMRVERIKGQYRFQIGERIRTYTSFNPLFDALRKVTKGRSYLIQRGVHLLKYMGRRFDLRVMVQLTPRKAWETTGIIGRVAARRKIVTNYHNGGKLMPVKRLLSSHMSKQAINYRVQSLEKMGVRAAIAMRRKFPGVCEIGVDVGMDHTLTPWILEINTSPDPYIFRKLSDPSIFRKIKRYAESYGRL
jgi:glutathione synthase/RimK-type ligase-like ATP-grasp enzyme